MPDSTPEEGTWEEMLWQAIGAFQVNREQFLAPAWISYKGNSTMYRGQDPANNATTDGGDYGFTIYRKGKTADNWVGYQVIEGSLDWFNGGGNAPDTIYNDHFIKNFNDAIANHKTVLDPHTFRSAANSFGNAEKWIQDTTAELKPTIDELGGEHPEFAGNAAGAFHHWIYNLQFEFDNLRDQILAPSSYEAQLKQNAQDADAFI